MKREFFVYIVCKPIYAILTPFVLVWDMITSMSCDYPYATSDERRKELKSFDYNYRNTMGFLKDMGCVFYVRYKLRLAEEGFDYVEV